MGETYNVYLKVESIKGTWKISCLELPRDSPENIQGLSRACLGIAGIDQDSPGQSRADLYHPAEMRVWA